MSGNARSSRACLTVSSSRLPDQKFAAEEQSSLVGVDPRKYPCDFGVFVRYNPELKRTIPARYPIPPALALADFEEFLTESPEQYRITWR
jgi:hypothetical protein